jgi:hypothetical protein
LPSAAPKKKHNKTLASLKVTFHTGVQSGFHCI